jgi:(heptosyl)LPS beta-1,4-glucosyltransferase
VGSRISAVINTRNEEQNLPFALRSVAPWVDEIIVVDMQSTDGTLDVARAFGAATLSVEPSGFVEPARALAVGEASGDWILVLDADELVPEPLSRRLMEIASADAADVAVCSRRNFLLGAPLTGGGWDASQDVHPRFFRKGCLTFRSEIHSVPEPVQGARVITIGPGSEGELAIQHFNYLGFRDFIDRLNSYTTVEAEQASARGESSSLLRAAVRAAAEFVWRLVVRRGFRDGWRGVYLSGFMGMYRLVVKAKQKQLEVVGSDEKIDALYRQEAERILSHFPAHSGRE